MTTETPWSAGRFGRFGQPRVLFGAMYEDPSVELAAFAGCERIFSIASSGDTARSLAGGGHRVDAVDINPAQLQYAVQRTKGAPYQQGSAEKVMALGLKAMMIGGWTRAAIDAFVDCATIEQQLDIWEDLTSGRGGLAFRTLLAPARLAPVYRKEFAAMVGPGFADALIARIRMGLEQVPNRDNPYVAMLFASGPPPDAPIGNGSVTFNCANAIAYLQAVPEGTFHAATVSNICDGTTEEFQSQLSAALRHALTPGAPVVFRTFRLATRTPIDNLGHRDRSLIWPVTAVVPVEKFGQL
jgi:hypothetical protein